MPPRRARLCAGLPAVADPSPLILTLAFRPADQARFDGLRQQHFPAALNHIPAHVTLFHHLPGMHHAAVVETLRAICAKQAPFPTGIAGLRSLGRGVAFDLHAPPLLALRGQLARAWQPWLTKQDSQGYRPHITIQNKVAPEEAKQLLQLMQASFTPFSVDAIGLALWWYRGGPWDLAEKLPFSAGG